MVRLRFVCIFIALATLSPRAKAQAQEADRVSFRLNDKKTLNINIGSKPFAVYRLNMDGELPKPFLLPVRAADGTIVTRPLENPEDHPHHKGVWVSVDKVNEVDFWAEKGRIVTKSIDIVHGKAPKFHVVNDWQSLDGKPIVREETWITVFPNRLMTYDIRFKAAHGPVTFGDTKEGLFGFRMVNSLREKETGKVVNAEGKKGTRECWGQQSKWIDYFGKIESKTYGVTLMDHPKNFRKSRYHVRNYGLFSISPFGDNAYTKGKEEAKPVELKANNSLQLRYAIYFHDGDTKQGKVEEAYKLFLKSAATK